jgi:hypothetical protein
MDASTSSTAPIEKSNTGRRLVRFLSDALPARRLRFRTEVSRRSPAAIKAMPRTWMARRTCPPLQVRGAHDAHLTTVVDGPTAGRVGRPAPVTPVRWWHSRAGRPARRRHRQLRRAERPAHHQEGHTAPDADQPQRPGKGNPGPACNFTVWSSPPSGLGVRDVGRSAEPTRPWLGASDRRSGGTSGLVATGAIREHLGQAVKRFPDR